MIKVNLLRTKVGDSQAPASAMGGGGDTQSDTRNALTRLVFIFLFTLGLMFYESQNIRTLNRQLVGLQVQANELEQAAQVKAKEVEGVKDVESEARELEDKRKILKLLARLRLREVKTLDFMQREILEKVWLRDINFASDKIKVEEGRFQFRGSAVATEDLAEFVKRLEDSSYLTEVIIVKNQEVSAPNRPNSLIRDFEFTALVEVRP